MKHPKKESFRSLRKSCFRTKGHMMRAFVMIPSTLVCLILPGRRSSKKKFEDIWSCLGFDVEGWISVCLFIEITICDNQYVYQKFLPGESNCVSNN
mmetsp:Transcript_33240/g.80411  ORF Transcript_33240/g.80411 Transcript_33240/m.80411 type:complete len:96 (+) Transcript_33240:1253-1540(+)